MKNKLSDLNNHLFEAIEMLKNNSDPNAEAHEKIDLPTAKQIADLGKVIVEGFKTQVQAIDLLSKSENITATINAFRNSGVFDIADEQKKLEK